MNSTQKRKLDHSNHIKNDEMKENIYFNNNNDNDDDGYKIEKKRMCFINKNNETTAMVIDIPSKNDNDDKVYFLKM
jgi:hypothetical protein